MRSSARVAAPLAALLLAGCAGAPAGTSPTSAPTSQPVPAPTSPTAAGSVAAERLRACAASDVITTTEADGASGVALRIVRILARPGVSCLLGGYPRARTVTDGAAVPVRRDPFVPGGVSPQPFVLSADRAGVVQLGWRWGRWCAAPVTVQRVELAMPGGGTVAAEGFGRSRCDTATFPDEHTGTPVSVSRFLPER